MKREVVLKEMKEAIGTKDPIEFFDKLVDVLGMLFDRLDQLEDRTKLIKMQTNLSISWDARVASDMLAKQVKKLRDEDKELYHTEISAMKVAFAQDVVTQDYKAFCDFWTETLGWHPFLD